MAQGLVLVSGSPLIGSPITYQVQAAVVSGKTAFHRVKLTVKCSLSGSSRQMSLTLSSPAESGEVLKFDISSALRAAADEYEYTPYPQSSYPTVSYSLEVVDEYMQNGEVHDNVGKVTSSGGTCYLGAFSDYERLVSGGNRSMPSSFTRKPNTMPEVVSKGEKIVIPGSSSGCAEYTANAEGLQTIGGRQFFVLPDNTPDRYEFRFVNGLGVLESISVRSLAQESMNVTQETFIRAVQETFGSFSRGIVKKKNDYDMWKLSSGPLDKAWQAWFMHEFLMCKFCWVKVGEVWIPCHIVPEETVAGVDRTQTSLREVQFTVRFDLNGSVLPELAV